MPGQAWARPETQIPCTFSYLLVLDLVQVPTTSNLEKACSCRENTWNRASQRRVRELQDLRSVELGMSDFLDSPEQWKNLIKQHDATVDELERARTSGNCITDQACKGVAQYHFAVFRCEVHATINSRKTLSSTSRLRWRQVRSGRDHKGLPPVENVSLAARTSGGCGKG